MLLMCFSPGTREDIRLHARGRLKTIRGLRAPATCVKEIAVAPGAATIRYTIPMPGDSPRRGGKAEEVTSARQYCLPSSTPTYRLWPSRSRMPTSGVVSAASASTYLA